MNVFIQGMRRSGTTIVFDVLWEDGSFDCYYEPLAQARNKAIGGGSGEHSVDLFDKIKSSRAAFMAQYPKLESVDLLNYGAPRQAELEFEPELPDYCREYINFIISQSEHTVIKFTRMYCKVHVLWEIDPNAKFIHVVRDPRSVTTSYLFGKHRKNRYLFPNERVFFRRKSSRSSWSSFRFSEFILKTPEYSSLKACEDFVRILVLWKYKFRKTHDAGRELFGKNYLLLRHEDLISSQPETIRSLYDFMERPLPLHVIHWAGKHVRRSYPCYAPDHPRWREAFRRLNMKKELELAGYDDSVREPGMEKDMELAGSGDSFNLGRLNRWFHGLRSKFKFGRHEDGLLLDD
jgi:REP element-mobilizing transposase RayT